MKTVHRKSSERAVASWSRHNKHSKTLFVNFGRDKGEESLTFGYGHAPTVLSGGRGVPVGLGFDDHRSRSGRSYLILAFEGDWVGPELARYMGGVVKTFRGEYADEEQMMAAFAVGALERCIASRRKRDDDGPK